MLKRIFGKRLEDVLFETKAVRVKGIKFTIKKVNMINYLDGSKVLLQAYDTYKMGKSETHPMNDKKIKEHFSHVLVSGIQSPKLSHTKDGEGTWVEDLFIDWDLVNELYSKIIEFTYGKKKLNKLILAENGSSN